ncbi:hypothetical protein RHS04_08480 [Rhizoctonia solani]|uniref:Uncharacterized protein n=1 Tax=Rhizoctonia solani TaxID=456999 RepID=A0A8H7LGF3_9AGAM|nr:hypothetical protein RHS04_08480 [Rhizoctonia solani]
MSPPMFSACLSFYQVYDEQRSSSRFPGVISSQPTPRSGMVIAPLPVGTLEKHSSGAERLRGGGGCCGGGGGGKNRGAGGQPPSPLGAQPAAQIPQPDVSQATRKAPEASQPAKPVSARAPRLSESTPSSQTARKIVVSAATASAGSSLAPPKAEAGRANSSPTKPSKLSPVSQPATHRTRHLTLPSAFTPPQQASASSTGTPPVLDGPIHYPGGVIRSPAFPPSVYAAGGARVVSSGPSPSPPPFMND